METELHDIRIKSLADKIEAGKHGATLLFLNKKDDVVYLFVKLDKTKFDETWQKSLIKSFNDIRSIYKPNRISIEQFSSAVSCLCVAKELDTLEDEIIESLFSITGLNMEDLKKSNQEDYFDRYINNINPYLSDSRVSNLTNDLRFLVDRRLELIDVYNKLIQPEGGGGCYIATLAYGDYNHPKVIVLRNFRDNYLEMYYMGRLFIMFYYFLSPKLVRIFKSNNYFIFFSKVILNLMISMFSSSIKK
jgi:hypothetical protein